MAATTPDPTSTAAAPAPRRRTLPDRYSLFGLLIVLPAVLFFLVFRIGPIFYAIWVSFTTWNLVSPMRFTGLKNYARVFDDDAFWQAMGRSFGYALMVVLATLVVGLALAVLLDRNLKARSFYRASFFSPTLLGAIVVSIVWRAIYNPSFGPIETIASLFGLQAPAVLASTSLALPGIGVMGIWQESGFYMMIFLAGLQSVPPHLYEAAMIDGAGGWARFRHITLPMIRPVTLFALVTSVIGALQVFGQVYVMTRGGPAESTTVAVYYIYRVAFYFQEMGYGSALAMVLFVVIMVLTLLNLKFVRAESYY